MPFFQSRLFFRIISKNPEVYILKVITLAIAFACTTLIILFSLNEYGYDSFHHKPDSVFRILQKNESETFSGSNRLSIRIPDQILNTLRSFSADSVIVSRVRILNGLNIRTSEQTLQDQKIHAVDPEITDIFSFEILNGSPKEFKNERSALISETAALHYFGDAEASGKELRISSDEDTVSFKVAAVYKDFPKNSHEDFNTFIIILICITSLILFLALTNFINLTTLTLPYRSKELAIKKLVGTSELNLILAFTRESFTLTFAALVLGLSILLVFSSFLRSLLGFDFISLLIEGDLVLITIMAALFLIVGAAPVMMTFKFARATPTRLLSTETISFPRFKRIITFLQLGISIFLIVASMVIKRQINHSLIIRTGT